MTVWVVLTLGGALVGVFATYEIAARNALPGDSVVPRTVIGA